MPPYQSLFRVKLAHVSQEIENAELWDAIRWHPGGSGIVRAVRLPLPTEVAAVAGRGAEGGVVEEGCVTADHDDVVIIDFSNAESAAAHLGTPLWISGVEIENMSWGQSIQSTTPPISTASPEAQFHILREAVEKRFIARQLMVGREAAVVDASHSGDCDAVLAVAKSALVALVEKKIDDDERPRRDGAKITEQGHVAVLGVDDGDDHVPKWPMILQAVAAAASHATTVDPVVGFRDRLGNVWIPSRRRQRDSNHIDETERPAMPLSTASPLRTAPSFEGAKPSLPPNQRCMKPQQPDGNTTKRKRWRCRRR